VSALLAMAMAAQQPTERAVSQSQLDAISVTCKTPRRWLRELEGDGVQFLPSRRAKFKDVDCVLDQLRKGLVPMKLGFVGNEASSETEK